MSLQATGWLLTSLVSPKATGRLLLVSPKATGQLLLVSPKATGQLLLVSLKATGRLLTPPVGDTTKGTSSVLNQYVTLQNSQPAISNSSTQV